MKKYLLTAFLLAWTLNSFSQCDTAAIEQIVNHQLKLADKSFKQHYVLKASPAFNETHYHYKPDSIYHNYACNKDLSWSEFNLTSKFAIIEKDMIKTRGLGMIVSSPIFNQEMTKCKFVVIKMHGEWGGNGKIFYYKKKRKRWKLVSSKLLWVS